MTTPPLPRPPSIPPPLDAYVSIEPPVGPEGWPGYHYPAGDRLQIHAYLDAPNRALHIHATHRPWRTYQIQQITELLTHLANWLDDLPPVTPPDPVEQPPPTQ
jgi:hypothetical protein